MKTIWRKKVSWFKPKKEIILPELEWEFTYTNSLGNSIECVIIKHHDNGYVDVLNKNGVKVFQIKPSDLKKITE